MTHEELLKEMHEVCQYLLKKDIELKERYGDAPEFDSRDDAWSYRMLKSLCHDKNQTVMEEYEALSGYMFSQLIASSGITSYHSSEISIF